MALISKHKIKLLKLFLVSPNLEKIFLLVYIVVVPLLTLSNKFGSQFSGYYLSKQLLNTIHASQVNSIQTLDDVTTWIAEDLATSLFTNKTTITKPLFPIFLFKSVLDVDSGCAEDPSTKLEAECSFTIANLKKTTSELSELRHRDGAYGTYPVSYYQAVTKEGIKDPSTLKSQLDSFLDGNIVFLSVQSIVYNDWKSALIIFSVDFESSALGEVTTRNISYDIVYGGLITSTLLVVLYMLFIIQLVIFTMKILFEFSIYPNWYTFGGHLIHFALQYGYVLITALILQDYGDFNKYSDSLVNFFEKSRYINHVITSQVIINLVLIFYPFRLFTLLAWNKYLSLPVKLFIVLYRTFPAIAAFVFGGIVLWLCFSLASFIGLRGFVTQLGNYSSSLLYFFTLDFGEIATDDPVLNSSKKIQFFIIWILQNLFLILLILFALVIMIDAVKRSFAVEIPAALPHQIELQDKQFQLQSKFDKFLKELSSILGLKNKDSGKSSSFSSEDKMVIWLEHEMGSDSEVDDVIDQLSKDSVKIMVFYQPEEVEEFLKYLFRLKPNLLTSQAGARFRIVFETKFSKVSVEKNNIETLLDWLKEVGCRVPFLLFTKAELERETYIPMKKKYPAMFATEDKEGALRFCRMEGRLEDLGFRFENNENKYIILDNTVSDVDPEITSHSSVD